MESGEDSYGVSPDVFSGHRHNPRVTWTWEQRLADMDTLGVDVQVLSTNAFFYRCDMAADWPVSWLLGLQSLIQDEKEAILWKNLQTLLNL